MKICSWDIAEQNISYCIVEINENNEFTILEWEVFSLLNDIPICEKITKNKRCNKEAKFIFNNTNEHLCETHKKKEHGNIIKMLEKKPDEKCEYLMGGKKPKNCNKINCTKFNNINYCKTHLNKKIYFDKIIIDKNIKTIAINLFNFLNNHSSFLEVDEIYIENQPNYCIHMIEISMILFSYFLNICNNKSSLIKNVLLINAQEKLKNFPKEEKNTYAKRKKLSVSYTKEILLKYNDDYNYNKFINYDNKKDDLADCFLQIFGHLNINL